KGRVDTMTMTTGCPSSPRPTTLRSVTREGRTASCPKTRLGGERLLLLRERVDTLARRTCRLLHHDELREAVEHEDAVLLQLPVPDVGERVDDLLHVFTRRAAASTGSPPSRRTTSHQAAGRTDNY